MSAETERAGDGVDVESVEEEDLGEGITSKILNCPDVLAALQGRLHAEMMAALPAPVKRRIKALKKLQLETTNIEAKFFEEVHALECKYHTLYTPFYLKVRGRSRNASAPVTVQKRHVWNCQTFRVKPISKCMIR